MARRNAVEADLVKQENNHGTERFARIALVPPVLADAVADLCRFNLIIRFYRSDGADKRVFILYNNAPLVIVELLIVRYPQREDLLCYLYAAVRGPCEELCDPGSDAQLRYIGSASASVKRRKMSLGVSSVTVPLCSIVFPPDFS